MQQTVLITLLYEELDALIEASLNKFLSKLNNHTILAVMTHSLDAKEAAIPIKYNSNLYMSLYNVKKIRIVK